MKLRIKIFGCKKKLIKKMSKIERLCFHDNIIRFLKRHKKKKNSPSPSFFFLKKLVSVVHIVSFPSCIVMSMQ